MRPSFDVTIARRLALGALTLCLTGQGAVAADGRAWSEIRASIYGAKPIADGRAIITLEAPTRPEDMRVVPIGVRAGFSDGRSIKAVTVIIDENPTPVVAVFNMGPDRPTVSIKSNFRVDRQSDIRAVVEASDGQLYMVSQLIKFAGGQSSCSAPPMGDPAEIAANMGKIQLAQLGSKAPSPASSAVAVAKLELNHPNHTGMAMDQQTLLYTPMKMISEISVRLGEALVFTASGSIALSQNPMVEFDFVRSTVHDMTVTFKDTDGGSWERTFAIGPQS